MTNRIAFLAVLAMSTVPASAQLTYYTDEALFLADGFESGDTSAWSHSVP